MIDVTSQQPMRVLNNGTVGFCIRLPFVQLDDVKRLLDRHNVKYWVREEVISIDGGPEMAAIQLGRSGDPVLVQALLDSVTEAPKVVHPGSSNGFNSAIPPGDGSSNGSAGAPQSRLRVQMLGAWGPTIRLPFLQLGQVQGLLDEHQINYEVSDTAIAWNGGPEYILLFLNPATDVAHVQGLLDELP